MVRYADIADFNTLYDAWRQLLNKRQQSPPIFDAIEDLDYAANIHANLKSLAHRLKNMTYHPALASELPATKSNGMTRSLMLLDLEDQIVSQAIIFKLSKTIDDELSESVFAMRATGQVKKPFRGWYQDWPEYQNRLKTLLTDNSCVVVSDITGYFDNVDLRILKDLLLRLKDVDSRIIDLTLFMLESWMYRSLYGVAIGRGIPQADLDFPRALSNFFLYPHDRRMEQLPNVQYTRWIDDMNFVVASKGEGKIVIRKLEDSLKRMFLTPNSSKTRILCGHEIERHFLFRANDELTDLGHEIRKLEEKKCDREIRKMVNTIETKYRHFLDLQAAGGNWEKVLKRYYTIFGRLNSPHLVGRLEVDLNDRPSLDEKIRDYVLRIDFNVDATDVVLRYLKSEANLYPSTEIVLLDSLLSLRVPATNPVKDRIIELAEDVLYKDMGLHWYSKCLAVLLLSKYGKTSQIRKMAEFLIKSGDDVHSNLKRHLLASSFRLPSDSTFERVLDYARRSHDPGLARLLRFYESAMNWKRLPDPIKNRLTLKGRPGQKVLSTRTFLVLKMLSRNENLHEVVHQKATALRSGNEDDAMSSLLDLVIEDVS